MKKELRNLLPYLLLVGVFIGIQTYIVTVRAPEYVKVCTLGN